MKKTQFIIILSSLLLACQSQQTKFIESNISLEHKATLSIISNRDKPTIKKVVSVTQAREKSEKPIKQDHCANKGGAQIRKDLTSKISQEFVGFRLATKLDFYTPYWCYFYKENDNPYYQEGDFDGDGKIEFGLFLTTEDHAQTIIVIYDDFESKLETLLSDTLYKPQQKIHEFGYGLKVHEPDTIESYQHDQTFYFPNEFLFIDFFETGSRYYQWSDGTFNKLEFGC